MVLHQAIDQKVGVAVVLIAGAAAVSTYIYWKGRNKSRGKASMKPLLLKPEDLQNVKWECVGRVDKIWLYPVKSCSAVTLQEAQAWPLGLTDGKMRDRSFMISSVKGSLINGVKISGTVLIQPQLVNNNILLLKHPDMEDLRVDLDEVEENKKEASSEIYKDPVIGLDCGDDAAQWLEKVLKKEARLLYHSNLPSPRNTEKKVGRYPLLKGDDNSLYANTFPYMLMTKESIADLQTRLDYQVSPEDFRPNILVEGAKEPYDEDDWAYVKIGDAIFRNIAPCTRCVLTTVDHKTGIKEPNMEPLRTLRKYRLKNEKDPILGINLGLELLGSIKSDDEVFITRFSQM